MKEKYEFKDSVKYLYKGIDAQRVGEEIKNLGGTEENPVKPEMILEYAKNNTESELHKCIDWNDSVAAEKWRLAQARHVTRSIVIVRNDEKLENQPKFEVRAFLEETRTAYDFNSILSIIQLAGFGGGIGSGRTSGYGRFHLVSTTS